MNLLSLEYFCSIVEERSFSQAAKKLHVSQQSLSEHVKKIEKHLGVILLERGKKLTLTSAGECLYDGAISIFEIKNRMLDNIADNQGRKISIGVSAYEVPSFISDLLMKFSEQYPEYSYEIFMRREIDLLHNMSGIDLYIGYRPIDHNLEQIVIVEENNSALVVDKALIASCCDKENDLKEGAFLGKKELLLMKDLPFILSKDKYGQKELYLEKFFEYAGFDPVIGFQSNNGELNAAMCIRGFGAFVASLDYCKRKFSAELNEVPNRLALFKIALPDNDNSLVICHEKGKLLNAGEDAFIEAAKSFFSSEQ